MVLHIVAFTDALGKQAGRLYGLRRRWPIVTPQGPEGLRGITDSTVLVVTTVPSKADSQTLDRWHDLMEELLTMEHFGKIITIKVKV